jgi:hypothetical protein
VRCACVSVASVAVSGKCTFGQSQTSPIPHISEAELERKKKCTVVVVVVVVVIMVVVFVALSLAWLSSHGCRSCCCRHSIIVAVVGSEGPKPGACGPSRHRPVHCAGLLQRWGHPSGAIVTVIVAVGVSWYKIKEG